MKKVVLATLLACAVTALGLPSAFAQTPVQLGSQPAGQIQMPDAEYTVYSNAMNQSNPQAKAAGIETYLASYPNSAVKLDTLVTLMSTYSGFDAAKTLNAADRVLQLDPTNLQALTFEAYLRKLNADSLTDPTAKQAALDAAAQYAQRGLAAPKPTATPATAFKTLQATAFPIFYNTVGDAATAKKDNATAIDAYKKLLNYVPLAETENPKTYLQDVYQLASAYYQSTPPDYLDCTFYMSRFVAYAPEPYKSQAVPVAKYCYTKFHGGPDGYDALVAAATANLNPPAGLFASITPAPTPVQVINNLFNTTPDLATLAVGDKEFVLQNGTPDQAAKVWSTIVGKSVELPGALVIASSPTVLKVAISDDSVQGKTADFTFNMTPPEEIPEPSAKATLAQKALYKKKVAEAQKQADAIAAATAVGQTVTLTGTYDSFTPNPIQIIMKDGAVVLPKAEPTKPAPTHHAARTPRK